MVSSGAGEDVVRELRLSDALLSAHPKSWEGWCHRRIVVRRAAAALAAGDAAVAAGVAAWAADVATGYGEGGVGALAAEAGSVGAGPTLAALGRADRHAATRAATALPRNYYAWAHRLASCREHCVGRGEVRRVRAHASGARKHARTRARTISRAGARRTHRLCGSCGATRRGSART
jgi:hypothetical protein